MTDESREIDNLQQLHKLGVWGKGLQKGVTQYTQETYDQEKEAMAKIAEVENTIRDNLDITDNNRDIHINEYIEQQQRDNENDAEAYDMSHMNEDYDDGNYGGDEIDDDYE